MNPSVSRRDFVRTSAAGIGSGTALGSLLALGASVAPATARAQQLRIKDAKATPSVCPYCAVGCATIVRTIGNEIVDIEGDLRSLTMRAAFVLRAPPPTSCTRTRIAPPKCSTGSPAQPAGRRSSSTGPWTVWPI
jgi:anaerobic selenocysteine-containing dehydrogenase